MLKIDIIKPPYIEIFDRVMNGDSTIERYLNVPDNKMLDRRYQLIPYFSDKVALKITSDLADRVVSIKVQSDSASLKINPRKETTTYLQNLQQTILVDLEEGPNFIVIKDEANGESDFLILNCRRYVGLLYGFIQDYYNNIQIVLAEQQAAVNSKYATRLVEPLLGKLFYLLSDIKSLQTLSTRLITKTLVDKSGYEIGVREMGAALTLNTPMIFDTVKNERELDLVRFPLLSYSEFYAGKLAHLWVPNTEIIRWKTFQTYIDNLEGVSLVDISEEEIIIKNESTGEQERHIFDFEKNKNFFSSRKYAVDIFIQAASELAIQVIAPGYPFDLYVDEFHLMGNDRATFDMGIPLDSGLTFDSEIFDEKHDGYLGMSLIDRNEMTTLYENLSHDSTIYSPNTSLVFNKGYYCKGVDLESLTISVDYSPTVSGTYV